MMLLAISRFLRTQTNLTKTPIIIRSLHKELIQVSWEKPRLGWIKLNFDGSSKGRTGKASIGGVFRNHNAEFILGYAQPIGIQSSTMAEIAALRRGLELILENGWKDNVWLEGDAKTLVDYIVNRKHVRSLEVKEHVDYINKIISHEFSNYEMTHVYREGNRVADKFAKLGHCLDKPGVWRDVPPEDVLPIVHEDALGKIVLRNGR